MLTAIGVISGTSMDAIDVSLVTSDGRDRLSFGPGASYPYRDGTRRTLQAAVADARRASSEPLAELEAAVTADHLAAIRSYAADQALDLAAIDLVGLHGQTIYHRPERRFTRQLIDGQAVADALGTVLTSVVNDNDRLMLPGLGTLKKVHKNARVARNPRTGEEIHVAAREAIEAAQRRHDDPSAAAPRTRAGRYDYRRFRRAIGGAALNPRDFERPAREEGDIEISSVGIFVWRDGRSVRMDGERNG